MNKRIMNDTSGLATLNISFQQIEFENQSVPGPVLGAETQS